MATLNQIVDTIKNIYSGGITKVDFPFRDAQIAFMVDYHSALLRKLDIDSKGFIDSSNIQDLGCQKLTKIDAADCTLVNFGTDIKYVDIPNTLQLKKANAIEYFGSIDKTTIIPIKDPDIIPYDRYIRFPKNIGISASQIGNRIYVRGANAVDLCYVNIRGAFQTPSQVMSCNSFDTEPTCYDWDCQYPIGEHLLSDWVLPNGQPILGLFSRILNNEMKLGLTEAQMQQADKQVNPV